MNFTFSLIITALIISLGHWFPWHLLLGKPLPRLAAYAYGVGSILIGVTVWRGLDGDWQTVLGIAAISAAAGLATVLAYGVDRIAAALHHERLAEMTMEDNDASTK